MKQTLDKYLNTAFQVGLIITVLSTLFFFLNSTTDFYETPKFFVLLVFTGIFLVLSTVRFAVSERVVFSRTPLDLPLLLLLVIGIVSTVLSPSPFIALLGNQLKLNGSLVAWAIYIIFYFIVINNLKGVKNVRKVVYLLVGSGLVLSVISLLSYAGLTLLPKPWTHGLNFTPTGSNFATTAILSLLLPVAALEILGNSKPLMKVAGAVALAVFGVTIALTGVWATYVAALVGLGVVLLLTRPKLTNSSLPLLIGPVIIVAAVTLLSYIPPVGNTFNPFYTQAQKFPRETQLPFPSSWKVSVSAFRDSPFWGTGPATYLFNFTNYKPIEFNQTSLWNVRFDSAFNEYLDVLASLGGIGLLALLSLTALYITAVKKTFRLRHPEIVSGSYQEIQNRVRNDNNRLTLGLAIAGLLFFVILLLHASTLALWVVGLILIAGFMALNTQDNDSPKYRDPNSFRTFFNRVANTVAPTETSSETIRIDALPSILLIAALVLVGGAFFLGGQYLVADFHHRTALNAVAQNQGLLAYNELVAAERLNPYSDVYRTDLAQTNFALANAIAVAKGPSTASPSGTLTDADKQNIQVLLQQAINEGRNAVSLAPRSTVDWEILGNIYRQISGVAQNALLFALDSYGRSIQNDPLNPLLRLNVGGTYYAIKNYDMAIRFFTDAINLKPDYPNAYYNLAVALRDKGDVTTAQQVAEQLLTLIKDKNSQDYQTASKLLDELKNSTSKAASESSTPPAAQSNSALNQKELPKVIDLPKPDSIATPSAVKKPNSTPEPTPSPTATPIPN